MDGRTPIPIQVPLAFSAYHVTPQAMTEWVSHLPLNDAGLSLRAQNCLQLVGVTRVGELLTLGLGGLSIALDGLTLSKASTGPKVLKEVEAFLAEVGISTEGGER